jgi:predicted transcriptional regulator
MTELSQTALAEMTSEVVAAYVAQNHIQPSELPNLIASVHMALGGLGKAVEPSAETPKPAVPVKKSITDDYLISLEDGRKFKSLKKYLAGLGMTPADYRAKWGLPNDYPMVAPSYAAKRSELAKSFGLGRKRQEGADEV